jgi:hypothetical protein
VPLLSPYSHAYEGVDCDKDLLPFVCEGSP